MNRMLIACCLLFMGCNHIQMEAVREATTKQLPPPKAHSQPYEGDIPPELIPEPRHTWVTLDEIHAAEEKKLQDLMVKSVWGNCAPGDPQCSSLKEEEVKP